MDEDITRKVSELRNEYPDDDFPECFEKAMIKTYSYFKNCYSKGLTKDIEDLKIQIEHKHNANLEVMKRWNVDNEILPVNPLGSSMVSLEADFQILEKLLSDITENSSDKKNLIADRYELAFFQRSTGLKWLKTENPNLIRGLVGKKFPTPFEIDVTKYTRMYIINHLFDLLSINPDS